MSDVRVAPVMDIVAGPQGSGKSDFFPVKKRGFDSFNIDERRKELNGGSAQNFPSEVVEQARKDYEAFIETHIAERRSFSFECTLGRHITFDQAARARESGFQVHLTYVATDLEKSIARVIKRAHGGGHGAKVSTLQDVYSMSTHNLERALRLFDVVQVYDNSVEGQLDESLYEAKPPRVLEAWRGVIVYVAANPPGWLKSALAGTEFDLD